MHGAFQSGTESTEWMLKGILKGAFYLLHDSPARHADYTSITDGITFLLYFCDTRWVEDKRVNDRLVEIFPNIVKFIDYYGGLTPSKRPTCKSYENIKNVVNDVLTV